MDIIRIKIWLSSITPIISAIIPKKKKLWLFGCWFGKLYADNSKYLFEYICENHPEIECVWLTRYDLIKKEVEAKGKKCYKRFSIKGIWNSLRAEVAFVTSDEITDISPFVNRKHTKIIQLFHGIAGKGSKIALSDSETIRMQKRFHDYFWIATSNKYIDVFSKAYKIDPNSFYLTGYPRNDTFVHKPKCDFLLELLKKYSGYKWIIYMPTHRGYGKKPIDICEFDTINETLKKHRIMMVYKPHYMELKNVIDNNISCSNIIIAKDQEKWGDVYSYIHYFDLLISDYSSIVYDFLCADKPIVLYTYDIEYMRNDDFGIMDYFEEIPAGPFCYSWEETIDQTIKLLENDTWHEKRNQCRDLFHPFKDGKNSERVFTMTNDYVLKK